MVKNILILILLVASTAFAQGKLHKHERPIPERYIVVLKGNKYPSTDLARKYGGKTNKIFTDALNGFSATLTPKQAERLSKDDKVLFVEEQTLVYLHNQTNPPWGLDRVDQRVLPLNFAYMFANTGAGVNVYVIDSGINTNHVDFEGRASIAFDGVAKGKSTNNDCSGHGTHVAGTIGGATYGVAKGVNIKSVRVFGCAGSTPLEDIIEGIDWVARRHSKPAVANLSLGAYMSASLDTATRNLSNKGVTVVASAGNSTMNACFNSPSRIEEPITVGATDENDVMAFFSNYGECVDVFAPGINILSASNLDNTNAVLMNGTSMASPHVTGAVAKYLQINPNAAPLMVHNYITNQATPDVVVNANGSPNRLLFTID